MTTADAEVLFAVLAIFVWAVIIALAQGCNPPERRE
jgi:hypothetical protein